jgi:hypothetical protein
MHQRVRLLCTLQITRMKDLGGGNCPSTVVLERSRRSLLNEVARMVVC